MNISASSSDQGKPQQGEANSSTHSLEAVILRLRHQIDDLNRTDKKIRKAYLLQRRQLESAQDRARKLEAIVQDSKLRALPPVTSFDITDEYISRELTMLYSGLFGWAINLPDAKTDMSYKDLLIASLKENGAANANLSLSHDEALWAEPELAAACIFAGIWEFLFQPLLVGLSNTKDVILGTLNEGISSLEPKKSEFKIQDRGHIHQIMAYM